MLVMVICLFKQVNCNRAVPSFPGNRLVFLWIVYSSKAELGDRLLEILQVVLGLEQYTKVTISYTIFLIKILVYITTENVIIYLSTDSFSSNNIAQRIRYEFKHICLK